MPFEFGLFRQPTAKIKHRNVAAVLDRSHHGKSAKMLFALFVMRFAIVVAGRLIPTAGSLAVSHLRAQ
ncbi:hypothetical protein ASG20_12160 [Sphingomonas sp. Leaf198]|nr:hypothetical protein ASG20_12160 [Sphingomonas sp. Leaf198]